MAPTNKIRARVASGMGELLAVQLAANRVFRENETTETAPLPRHIIDLDDVTRGLLLDDADVQVVHRLLVDTNAHFDQKTQTQRNFIAVDRFVSVLRAMPHIDSDTRMELTKRARAYWKRNTQTAYDKPPTIRALTVRADGRTSRPGGDTRRYIVRKAAVALNGSEQRSSMPQITAKKLPEYLREVRKDGTKTERKKLDPKKLKPTQNKLDSAKVKSLQNNPEALKKPIVVSKDYYILDGHHRWAACKELGKNVPSVVVKMNRDDLLEHARDFDGAEYRKADKIPGGLAQGKKPKDFDKKKLAAGIKVEMEHTDDRAIAAEIAMDHLTEDPDYYEKLAAIEKAEPTLVVQKSRPLYNPNIQVPQSRGAPRFDNPELPDFQSIYYPPETDDDVKRERDAEETRRQADAKRSSGKWGFHGEVRNSKPKIRWTMDRTLSADAFATPDNGQEREPRKSPKMSASAREEEGAKHYQDDTRVRLEGKDPKKKRKKKKKRVTLTARKTT